MLIWSWCSIGADQRGTNLKSAEPDGDTVMPSLLGLWQVVALIPGTSRSGITITGGAFAGDNARPRRRRRLSMLMSIPTIAASGVLLGGKSL